MRNKRQTTNHYKLNRRKTMKKMLWILRRHTLPHLQCSSSAKPHREGKAESKV